MLLPVRDGARFLPQALESLLQQTGVRLEILAIEDGSRDETPAILDAFARRAPQLRILSGAGRGLSRALNLGLAHARAPYIARLDADDLALPGRLAAQHAFLERHPEVAVLGTQALRIDAQGQLQGKIRVPCGKKRVRAALARSCALLHPSVMMRRSALSAVGGYRPALDRAEDYDLWLRLSEVAEIDNLPQPWILCRRHAGQVTQRHALLQARRSALARIAQDFRLQGRADPLETPDWRPRLQAADALDPLHALTAAALADNGGTLRPRGARLLAGACRRVQGDARWQQRLALAWVRHLLQLGRSGRGREVMTSLPQAMRCGKVACLTALVQHGAILWQRCFMSNR